MSQVSEIIQRVRAFAALPGWSKTKLSREIGLSPNALRDLDGKEFNPTADTLEKLEDFISSKSQDHPQ